MVSCWLELYKKKNKIKKRIPHGSQVDLKARFYFVAKLRWKNGYISLYIARFLWPSGTSLLALERFLYPYLFISEFCFIILPCCCHACSFFVMHFVYLSWDSDSTFNPTLTTACCYSDCLSIGSGLPDLSLSPGLLSLCSSHSVPRNIPWTLDM